LRRQEQEIPDRAKLEAILEQATVCRLGLVDGDWPYVVPVCFGYYDNALYIHCALEGYKLDILSRHPQVCFEVEVDVQVERAATPCAWSVRYASIIGWGYASRLDSAHEKARALEIVMAHYGDEGPYAFSEAALSKMTIIKVSIERMTGKSSRR
jgi:uncharacterized protein